MKTKTKRLKKCPRCNSLMPEGSVGFGISISRRDNKTPICSNCGTDEALIDAGFVEPNEKEISFKKKLGLN